MNASSHTALAQRVLNNRRGLVLDLDFTLLHLEEVPGSIEVPGRTRSAFIAPETVAALRVLQNRFSIILATARSWDGTRWVSDGLRSRGVEVAACVLEDGALLHAPEAIRLEPSRDWDVVRAWLEAQMRPSWPGFEWQRDFVACLVARAESAQEAAVLANAWAPLVDEHNSQGEALCLFRDGRKVYVVGAEADKWRALQYLLGPHAEECAGAGDGANDACWLGRIALPCTMPHAVPQVLAAVRSRGGFISPTEGHAGIAEVLRFLARPAP